MYPAAPTFLSLFYLNTRKAINWRNPWFVEDKRIGKDGVITLQGVDSGQTDAFALVEVGSIWLYLFSSSFFNQYFTYSHAPRYTFPSLFSVPGVFTLKVSFYLNFNPYFPTILWKRRENTIQKKQALEELKDSLGAQGEPGGTGGTPLLETQETQGLPTRSRWDQSKMGLPDQ